MKTALRPDLKQKPYCVCKSYSHFSEKEISTIINQLKLDHKVTIYDDNLDRLFQRNAIQN